MAAFGTYGLYYNLLYQDKDYAGETAFILHCLKKNGLHPRSLLDLGCGTGRHALEMTRHGISVTGVDLSDTMLDMGRDMLSRESAGLLPELYKGDARDVRLNRRFDAVTALFHVMSYQNSEKEALAVLQTAKAHLDTGGLFLFDFWYGPCVLKERPEHRVKTMENSDARVDRTATPSLYLDRNMVNVHYHVDLLDKNTGKTTSIEEDHPMRYWFFPELKYLAKEAGFQVRDQGAWMNDTPAGDDTWGAWLLLEAKDRD